MVRTVGVNTSLIREIDLKPTIHDLDNMFASDSEGSDSDMVSSPRTIYYGRVLMGRIDRCYDTPT
jgi:hypothetical protein